MSNFSNRVKIQHRINHLKAKAGATPDDRRQGFIAPEAIKKAQNAIDNKKADYKDEIAGTLKKLEGSWQALKTPDPGEDLESRASEVYNYSNNIKDMADTFNDDLMGYFGNSLRNFCERLAVENKAHHVIVQAHIDVMNIALRKGITDEGGKQALELKEILNRAIEKHG